MNRYKQFQSAVHPRVDSRLGPSRSIRKTKRNICPTWLCFGKMASQLGSSLSNVKLNCLQLRLIFAPGDKVDMVWSSLASQSFEPSIICSFDVNSDDQQLPSSQALFRLQMPLQQRSLLAPNLSRQIISTCSVFIYPTSMTRIASPRFVPWILLVFRSNEALPTQTVKLLLNKHGMNLSGVKSNLYTAIGGWLENDFELN